MYAYPSVVVLRSPLTIPTYTLYVALATIVIDIVDALLSRYICDYLGFIQNGPILKAIIIAFAFCLESLTLPYLEKLLSLSYNSYKIYRVVDFSYYLYRLFAR